jgi:hypothetical protein
MHCVKRLAGLGWVIAVVAIGCTAPSVRPIVGPDGSAMLHVHCGGDQAKCFELAGQSCPHGYDLSPIFDVSQGNYLVRCRQAVAARVVTPSAEAWRPNDDVVPLRPSPKPAVTSRGLPPTPRTASGDVDIGY